jgi:hypothetical protein
VSEAGGQAGEAKWAEHLSIRARVAIIIALTALCWAPVAAIAWMLG